MPNLPLRLLVLGLALAGASAQQRALVDISGSTAACQDARVSPDGQFVAYRVGNSLASVRISGGAQISLLSSQALGNFVWAPSSGSLYAVEGNNVLALPRAGGGGVVLASVPGQSVWVWDVDGANTFVYGTRYDPATRRYHVFRLPTLGGQPHQDLFDSQDELSGLRIDLSSTYMLFLQRAPVPFAPHTLMRAQLDGSNPVDMLGAPVGVVAQGPDWIDAGDRAVLVTATTQGSLQLLRVDRVRRVAEPLTWAFVHQRPTVSPDGAWIVMEAVDGVGGNGPAILPVEGGGEVFLFTGERFEYAGSAGLDAVGGAVVFSARRVRLPNEQARVFKAELDGELRVWPRAELGQVVNFDLPCPAGWFGGVLLGLRSPPLLLSGIVYDYDLGPNFAILGLGAGGGTTPLRTTLPIPNIAALQGLTVDFQGLRWDPVAQTGEWTRSGRLPIF
jgi:hypothetical protein